MKRKGRSSKAKVPIIWRIISVLLMIPLGAGIFMLIFRKSGGRLPLQAGDSTDPLFFASVFGVLIPLLVYLFVVDKILKGIVAKRSAGDVATDVAKDIGIAAAEMAADVLLGGGASDDRRGSSGGGASGGGGSSGGGGASGGY